MNKNSSNQTRKKILNFASLWIFLILFITVSSLFSIWSMNKEYLKSEKINSNISHLNYEIRRIQLDFKTQIQEWKNTLLRGKVPDQREKYFSSFQASEKMVDTHFENSIRICSSLSLANICSNIKLLSIEHLRLASIYKNAIEDAPLDNYEAIIKVDNNVKGIDRDLQSNIDEIAETIFNLQKNNTQATNKFLTQRYITLRKILLIIISVSLLVAGMSIYSLLRNTKDTQA